MIESITKHDEIIRLLKMDKPYFNEHEFLDILKLKFATLYRSLKSNYKDYADDFCTNSFAKKLIKNKDRILMLDDDIDFVSIQRCAIRGYSQTNETIELKINIYLFYIDYMLNNKENADPHKKKYFDRAYQITLSIPFGEKAKKSETICPNCGSHLKKNMIRRCYVCDYCQFEKFIDYDDWKISNIEAI